MGGEPARVGALAKDDVLDAAEESGAVVPAWPGPTPDVGLTCLRASEPQRSTQPAADVTADIHPVAVTVDPEQVLGLLGQIFQDLLGDLDDELAPVIADARDAVPVHQPLNHLLENLLGVVQEVGHPLGEIVSGGAEPAPCPTGSADDPTLFEAGSEPAPGTPTTGCGYRPSRERIVSGKQHLQRTPNSTDPAGAGELVEHVGCAGTPGPGHLRPQNRLTTTERGHRHGVHV